MDQAPSTALMERMQVTLDNLEEGTLRHDTLHTALQFKANWLTLGEKLHEVFKSEEYKQWGYKNFEQYCSQEIGIRKNTAEKLTKSYYFLQVHRPELISEYKENKINKEIPDVNTVKFLADVETDERIPEEKYSELQQAAFDEGCSNRQLKKRYNDFVSELNLDDDEDAASKNSEKNIATLIQSLERIDRKAEDIETLPVEIKTDIRKLLVRIKALI